MPIASVRRLALGFALSLGLAAAASTQAEAAVIYDFTLSANGDVGPVRVVLTSPRFISPSGLLVLPVNDPALAVTSDPIDQDESYIGVDVFPGATLFGIDLRDMNGDPVLFTVEHPEDFFVFKRLPNETGTFTSAAGLVVSDDELDTRMPIATLVVSGTPDVPEPTTITLLGAAALGLIARRRRQ